MVLNEVPNHTLANQGLGVIAILEGRHAEGLEYLEIANEGNPEDPITHYYIGVALDALNQPAEAKSEFEIALALTDDPVLVELAVNNLQEIRKQYFSGARTGKEMWMR